MCAYIEMIFLSLMTIMVFALVVSRYLFSYSFAWVEELTLFLMIWMAFLGAAMLFRDNDHLSMDLVYKKLSRTHRNILDLLFGLAQIAFLIMLFRLGIQYMDSVGFIISPTLGISMRWPTLIIPVMSLLMIFFIFSNLIDTVFRIVRRSTSND